MTKAKLQQELKEKIKAGVKPSHLKKLKKSKSADDVTNLTNPPPQLLQSQLSEKQQQVENLTKLLEISNSELKRLKQTGSNTPQPTSELLDQSLIARHKSLKDWFTQYTKTKQLETELTENIDYASDELISQDNKISALQGKVSKLKTANQELEKDLKLAQRLAEFRKVPYPTNENNWTYLKYVLYSLGAVLFTLWLVNDLKSQEN